jgi:organic hydroperoxide reductase OsmC/OhrA
MGPQQAESSHRWNPGFWDEERREIIAWPAWILAGSTGRRQLVPGAVFYVAESSPGDISLKLEATKMSEHKVELKWKRETADFSYQSYSRDHDWTFDAGVTIRASAAPAYRGNTACVDPEEAFVASLSSCHMLTFLAIASRKRLTVDSYHDEAVGILNKDAAGRLAITEVTLRPSVEFSGETLPSAQEIEQMHEQAHHECFIANSVKTEVGVEPR